MKFLRLPPIGMCLAGVASVALALTSSACYPSARSAMGSPDNVILIIADSLRADHLGLYGYDKATSPFLDSLADQAVVYTNAFSHYPYTWPTIASLFTGKAFSELVNESLFARSTPRDGTALSPDVTTLAESLRSAGVTPVGVSANPYVTQRTGFGQGFVRFHDIYAWDPDFWDGRIPKYRADDVNVVVTEILEDLRRDSSPWFLYVHYFDPHMPYRAPDATRELFQDSDYAREGRVVRGYLRDPAGEFLKYLTPDLEEWLEPEDIRYLMAQYDAEVRSWDEGLRQLLQYLQNNEFLEDTRIIITADHGEAFMERDYWGHGYMSRSEEQRVPLLTLGPSRENQRIERPVTTTDIFFSVLAHFEGSLSGHTPSLRLHDVLQHSSWSRAPAYTEGPDGTQVYRTRRYSLYRYMSPDLGRPIPIPRGSFFYDRELDPGETRDLLGGNPLLSHLARVLGRAANGLPEDTIDPFTTQADPETLSRLRALGYIR